MRSELPSVQGSGTGPARGGRYHTTPLGHPCNSAKSWCELPVVGLLDGGPTRGRPTHAPGRPPQRHRQPAAPTPCTGVLLSASALSVMTASTNNKPGAVAGLDGVVEVRSASIAPTSCLLLPGQRTGLGDGAVVGRPQRSTSTTAQAVACATSCRLTHVTVRVMCKVRSIQRAPVQCFERWRCWAGRRGHVADVVVVGCCTRPCNWCIGSNFVQMRGIRGIRGTSPYPCGFQLIPHGFRWGIRGISSASSLVLLNEGHHITQAHTPTSWSGVTAYSFMPRPWMRRNFARLPSVPGAPINPNSCKVSSARAKSRPLSASRKPSPVNR